MFLVTPVRTTALHPNVVGRLGDLFVGELRPFQKFREVIQVLFAERQRRSFAVVNLPFKFRLVVCPSKYNLQIEDYVTVIGGERHTKPRQTLG